MISITNFEIELEKIGEYYGQYGYVRAKAYVDGRRFDIDVRVKFDDEGVVIDVFNNKLHDPDPVGTTWVLYDEIEAEDACPVCGQEIELSDGMDGKFYIYCPSCGPIPELAQVTEFSDTHILGYPPFLEAENDYDE